MELKKAPVKVWLIEWENLNRSYYKPKTERRLYLSEKAAQSSFTWHSKNPQYKDVVMREASCDWKEI